MAHGEPILNLGNTTNQVTMHDGSQSNKSAGTRAQTTEPAKTNGPRDLILVNKYQFNRSKFINRPRKLANNSAATRVSVDDDMRPLPSPATLEAHHQEQKRKNLGLPSIQVKNTETGSIRQLSSGVAQSVFHHITIGGERKGFWDMVDRSLGLHRVRTFGENHGDKRLAAKRAVYRLILILGAIMATSLLASFITVVVFGTKGMHMGPEWFVWIGVSAAGLIWSMVAFVMANRQRRKALHDEEIARQHLHLSRVQNGPGPRTMVVVGRPGENMQQAVRAGALGRLSESDEREINGTVPADGYASNGPAAPASDSTGASETPEAVSLPADVGVTFEAKKEIKMVDHDKKEKEAETGVGKTAETEEDDEARKN